MRLQASKPIRAHDILYLMRDGTVAPIGPAWQTYTRRERVIRWLGWLLHSARLAHYRDQPYIGVAQHAAAPGEMVTIITAALFGGQGDAQTTD